MLYSQVLAIIDLTGMTPEKAAKYFGLSGMTLRRWRKKGARAQVPVLYRPAIHEGIHRLVSEGQLNAEASIVRGVLRLSESAQVDAVIQSLGLPKSFSVQSSAFDGSPLDETWVFGLSQIGAQTEKQKEVEQSQKKLENFQGLGAEWKRRITILTRAIRSSKVSRLDKLVAFGALFYLITPFDFIPDHIPIFGLMDDFAVLGVATAYYVSKFGDLPS